MILERFEEKFIPVTESGCWLWTGTIAENTIGYGLAGFRNYTRSAHRLAYELYIGPIPDGMHVLHKCDVPSCVNPNHLWLGTHRDNMRDMVRKGRARNSGLGLPGETNGNSKLTEEKVRAIYVAKESEHVLAQKYGISRPMVSKIRRDEFWTHITKNLTSGRVVGKYAKNKLTACQIQEIKVSTESGASLARKFGVSDALISLHRTGRK